MAILQPLCEVLGISLNELFSGEHLSEEEYKGKAEENISRLFEEKKMVNLKLVKNLFSMCANVTLFVSVVEIAVGLVGSFFNPDMLKIMLVNASVWLTLYFLSMGKVMYDKNKLRKMKQSGVCLEADVKDMVPAVWVRVANYVSCRIVCTFWYGGKERKVLSNYVLLTPFIRKEDLYACVYVNKEKPDQYSMELFLKE